MLRQKRAAPSADQEREDIRAQLVGVAKKRVKVVKDYLVRLILLLVFHSFRNMSIIGHCQESRG